MHLLLIIDENKSCYVYIKDFMFHNKKSIKRKTENPFVKLVSNVLAVKMY